MGNTVIEKGIRETIEKLPTGERTLIVLKGIPLSIADPSVGRVSLERVVADKFTYFQEVWGKRKILSYEEFLLLAEFIVSQYKDIYIVENNIYMNQFPIEECFSEETRRGLLAHFSESEKDDDETYIGDIDEFIALFEGVKEYNGYLLGAYAPSSALSSTKINTINVFEEKSFALQSAPKGEILDCDLLEESDYIDFIKKLFLEPDELYVRIFNYTGSVNLLKEHIALVAAYWKDFTDIYLVESHPASKEFEHRPEYDTILKKYWGYDSYRELSIYSMEDLEQGKKKIVSISQEKVVSDIVQQVELCAGGSQFGKDVFVTAPTGAGKSVMFQVPAIYLAEKYGLLTLVISPLIGLMNDQVKNLELRNYSYAKTINSDISPIVKQDIIEKVSNGECHILYLSPETLLGRSDVEQLVGDRTIGMIVIDEAHIVTTWGKQFRPDYWYLGDHIRKLKKRQMERKKRSFVLATFTATAIYHGMEDMYLETKHSLHMLDPITYLGYVKRDDIDIKITRKEKTGGRNEYEYDKFQYVEGLLRRAILTNKKTLVYFPTVELIERCCRFLHANREMGQVAKYYGPLSKEEKQRNAEDFGAKKKLVMLATKAFGMGIDIDDIEIVAHFSPTGNVCDYVQEIGRAARREGLRGEAVYQYDPRDFKHINRLHGMSMIKPYQLTKVIQKVYELFMQSRQGHRRNDFTKKRNAMLLDAENFSYAFRNPISDENESINKVKTALLLIQKDFEAHSGFSPINVRPIPMFAVGFFKIMPDVRQRLALKYEEAVKVIDEKNQICQVRLDSIWERDYNNLSFPKFKFMLYSKTEGLELKEKFPMIPALCVDIAFAKDYVRIFEDTWKTLKEIIFKNFQTGEYVKVAEIVEYLEQSLEIGKYKAQSICEVFIASIDFFRKNVARPGSRIVEERMSSTRTVSYRFNVAVESYFKWVQDGFGTIRKRTEGNRLYLVDTASTQTKALGTILGIMETVGCWTFEMLGGANSQLYIYVNKVQTLRNISDAPHMYRNRLLDQVAERHLLSVKMLTYLYEGNFSSDEMWDLLENYFLGKIPEKVKADCKKDRPDMELA